MAINNTMGQGLLARHMGKQRVIAETGAGQHGVATATVAARLDQSCQVYMGAVDIKRQAINVFRMRLPGAAVSSVSSGSATLKDALNEAMRDWVTNVDDTFYVIGTVAGPHPYPEMVRDFNAVTGRAGYVSVTDEEALHAFHQLTRLEGIMPALESSHALAYGFKLAADMRPDQKVLINLSGRGDKDVQTVAELEGMTL